MWARFGPPRIRILLILGLVLFALTMGVALYTTLLVEGLVGPPFIPYPFDEVVFVIPSVSLTALLILAGISLWPAAGRPRLLLVAFLLFEIAGLALTLGSRVYLILFGLAGPGVYYFVNALELAAGVCTAIGTFLLLLLALRVATAASSGATLPPSIGPSPPPP